jgi:hypothetical protein
MAGTARGSETPASSTIDAPSASQSATSQATAAARRVFPTPPGPHSVTSRRRASSSPKAHRSSSRPTRHAKGCGKDPSNLRSMRSSVSGVAQEASARVGAIGANVLSDPSRQYISSTPDQQNNEVLPLVRIWSNHDTGIHGRALIKSSRLSRAPLAPARTCGSCGMLFSAWRRPRAKCSAKVGSMPVDPGTTAPTPTASQTPTPAGKPPALN